MMDQEAIIMLNMIVSYTKDAAEFIDSKYDGVGRSSRRRRSRLGNVAFVDVVGVGDVVWLGEHISTVHGLDRRRVELLVHDFMMTMLYDDVFD